MKLRSLVFAGSAAVLLAAGAPAANAETTSVGGAVVNGSLSLSITTPSAMTISPGVTPTALINQTTAATTAVSTGDWFLWVKEDSGDGNLDLVASTGCSAATTRASLSSALQVFSTGTVGTLGTLTNAATSGAPVTVSGTSQKVASGSLTQALVTNYKQTVPAAEQLKSGCAYALTATYTMTATDSAPA